jgi:hypothetical protein
MILNDINKCAIIREKAKKAYTRDSFIMECLMEDGSIRAYKYDDVQKMFFDMDRINNNVNILCE